MIVNTTLAIGWPYKDQILNHTLTFATATHNDATVTSTALDADSSTNQDTSKFTLKSCNQCQCADKHEECRGNAQYTTPSGRKYTAVRVDVKQWTTTWLWRNQYNARAGRKPYRHACADVMAILPDWEETPWIKQKQTCRHGNCKYP